MSELFGMRRTGNLVAEVLKAAGSSLSPEGFEPVECSYRISRRRLKGGRVRTIFVAKTPIFGKMQELMIELYRDYPRSTTDTSILFYRDPGLTPLAVIGSARRYDYVHIIKDE